MKTGRMILGIELYPDEAAVIRKLMGDKQNSQVLREALAIWCESQGEDFPVHETMPASGYRKGAGRPPKNPKE